MIYYIAVALVGLTLGVVLHKWIVREDLRLAEKVKVLLGAKVAAIKAEAAKAEAAIKKDVDIVLGKKDEKPEDKK